MSKLIFNKISIIESLNESDKKTGQLLAHDLRVLEIFHEKGIEIECVQVNYKHELLTHIKSLIKDANSNKYFPVVQLEVHGTDDLHGLALNSGENIKWVELEPYFRELNIACKCNLLVVMAACFGIHVTRNISLVERAPYWGLVAPEKAITPDVILTSLTKFYTALYTNSKTKNLLSSLETSSNVSELKFVTSEWFFVKAFKYYITNHCNEDVMPSRVQRVKNNLLNQGLKCMPTNELIKMHLKPDNEEEFNKFLNNFFMVDLFPENVDKISVKFEQLNL